MKYKEDIEKVRERLYAFWEGEVIDRALISVIAPNEEGNNISMFRNPKNLTNDPFALNNYWEDKETIYNNNIKRLEGTYLGGESLPIVFQNYGTSGHCSYYGAKASYGNDTIWFESVFDNLLNIKDQYNNKNLLKQVKIASYLTDRANDQYFVGMPDNTGTLDALGHLYGTQQVLMDMIEEPNLVKKAIKELNKGWRISNEAFYNTSKELNQGGAHAWMHLMAPGRLTHMQCDMSVMFSKEMYKEFVLPELEEQMEWIEYPVYHFDGIEQEQHLPYLLSLSKLKAIQWTHVAGQPSAAYYLPILQRIQKAGKRLIIMAPPEDIPLLLDGLSAKGLYIHTETNRKKEAIKLIAYVEKHSKERH